MKHKTEPNQALDVESPHVVRRYGFYKKYGFERAGKTEPMWIDAGHDS
jgi:hypothetical protein